MLDVTDRSRAREIRIRRTRPREWSLTASHCVRIVLGASNDRSVLRFAIPQSAKSSHSSTTASDPRSVKPQGRRIVGDFPWTRGSSAGGKTPKRDRPEARQPRTAQRGQRTLKGTKPQERRPIHERRRPDPCDVPRADESKTAREWASKPCSRCNCNDSWWHKWTSENRTGERGFADRESLTE